MAADAAVVLVEHAVQNVMMMMMNVGIVVASCWLFEEGNCRFRFAVAVAVAVVVHLCCFVALAHVHVAVAAAGAAVAVLVEQVVRDVMMMMNVEDVVC